MFNIKRMPRKLLVIFIHMFMAITAINAETFSQSLLTRAENGNLGAQYQLGMCYLDGNGVDTDIPLAIEWLERAASKGYSKAMVDLGKLLCNPYVYEMEPNYIDGFKWLRHAAKKGEQEAIKFISEYTKENEEIMHECPWSWLACDQDFDEYDNIIKNKDKIIEEYNKGNGLAMYYMAIKAYCENDYSKCVEYLKEAYPLVTNEDNFYEDFISPGADTMTNGWLVGNKVPSLLGWCYEFGQGVEQDYNEAAKYYLTDFDYTAFGLPRIPLVRAAFCYKKANNIEKFINLIDSSKVQVVNGPSLKVPCLMLELAEMYKNGDGVEKNPSKSLELCETIVDYRKDFLHIPWYLYELTSYPDLARAAYRAYKMYQEGIGCSKDEEMAKLYYEIALKYGDKNAWYENQRNYERNKN